VGGAERAGGKEAGGNEEGGSKDTKIGLTTLSGNKDRTDNMSEKKGKGINSSNQPLLSKSTLHSHIMCKHGH